MLSGNRLRIVHVSDDASSIARPYLAPAIGTWLGPVFLRVSQPVTAAGTAPAQAAHIFGITAAGGFGELIGDISPGFPLAAFSW